MSKRVWHDLADIPNDVWVSDSDELENWAIRVDNQFGEWYIRSARHMHELELDTPEARNELVSPFTEIRQGEHV